jgi:transposase InsO family protein
MVDGDGAPMRARWARLRFSIIGSLLANPPEKGDLQERIQELADKQWEHPATGEKVQFGFSTVEKWFYAAKDEQTDPFDKLARKTRKDSGSHPSISVELGQALAEQYRDHPSWQYQLHFDNIVVLAEQQPEIGKVPSYATVTRYMKDRGMLKQKKRRTKNLRALEPREKRSWEVMFVNQLWHLDFHVGSRPVVTPEGRWYRPHLLGVLDDHSRLACHVQWYPVENTENLIHGLSQALQKRDLPRALLTDGGGAMKAAETRRGLERSGIVHELTLPETPEQNGKQEHFWTQVETRLLPMLEGVEDLTLRYLNEATQAWVEMEYNHKEHSATGQTPIDRFLHSKNLGRPCPDSESLRDRFRMQTTRAQRRSDCTLSVEGRRFELPSRYRALRRVTVRYARWDLSSVDLIDARDDSILCTLHPLNRQRNADQPRRRLEPTDDPNIEMSEQRPRRRGPAPLLKELMATYASTGLPPAYIPKDENDTPSEEPCP